MVEKHELQDAESVTEGGMSDFAKLYQDSIVDIKEGQILKGKIIGINPKEVDYGEKLSPQIENKIPQIISMIKEEAGISNL